MPFYYIWETKGEELRGKKAGREKGFERLTIELLKGLLARLAEAVTDLGLSQTHLEQGLGLLEELSSKDNDEVGAVTNLLLLLVGAKHEHLARRVNDVHLLQHRGGIVGDKELVQVVDNHLVLAYQEGKKERKGSAKLNPRGIHTKKAWQVGGG